MIQKDDFIANINKKDPIGLNKHGESYKVLVVDDSTVMRKMITQTLRSEAFDICGEAANGEEAIELYKELKPDVVTMDINMPKMDGVTALQKILEYDKDARIIMLTSEGQKETVINAISMGAKNYIVKPPDRAKVIERVQNALSDG
jgi:two-component system chemotaxis response regulator CheY